MVTDSTYGTRCYHTYRQIQVINRWKKCFDFSLSGEHFF